MTTAAFLSSRAEKLASVLLQTKRYVLGLSNKGGSDEERKSLAQRFDSSVGEWRTVPTVERSAAAIHRTNTYGKKLKQDLLDNDVNTNDAVFANNKPSVSRSRQNVCCWHRPTKLPVQQQVLPSQHLATLASLLSSSYRQRAFLQHPAAQLKVF